MKRNERTNYNHVARNIRKNGIESIINIEVPTNYTHEARQAFHELLTAYNLRAVCIYWNDIEKTWALHYEPARYPEAHDEKRRQEAEDVDAVTARMTRRNWTWNGYPAPAAEAEAETAEQVEEIEADTIEETAEEAKDVAPMKKYFKVTFEYAEGIYCTNLAHAETAEDVEREYSKYPWQSVKEAQPWDVEEAKMKGMPIIDVDPAQQPQEAPQEAPAAEAEQQPTETENAPQAATQAAEGTAQQADDITAAILGAIGAPAPAKTITATLIGPDGTPYRATYSADLLDSLRTEPRVLDIQDDETGELIYIKPDDAPAAQAEADPTETTNEKKEEDKTMSNTERYDYLEHMTADVIDAIKERYTPDEIREHLDDRDDFAQELNDDLWTDDSVTGNASGSYYCNAWRAEDAIAHNWDIIADVIDEWDCPDILRKGPEAIDVSIRCYLLGQAIDAALDHLDDEIPEAEDDNAEDDEDAADNIPA